MVAGLVLEAVRVGVEDPAGEGVELGRAELVPDKIELEVVGIAVALAEGWLDGEVDERAVVVVVVTFSIPNEKSSHMAENSVKGMIGIKTRSHWTEKSSTHL